MPGTWRICCEDRSATLRLPTHVGAVDLDVDGRGQAEVEDLRDDVGGQEVEGGAGELAREASCAARA